MSARQKQPATIADLERLIALISDRLYAAGSGPAAYTTEAWCAYKKKGEDIIVELVAHHGAGFRAGVSDASHLSLAGIRTSCTGGEFGLLRNWQVAARRRIEAMRTGSTASEMEPRS